MKQMKILKRPAPPAPPTSVPDRVSAEISKLMEAAMSRERSRLEATFRVRQEALLRAISTVLNENLERALSDAARRETDALLSSFAKLMASQPQPPFDTDSSVPPEVTAEAVADTRASFATAFERAALPLFEKAVSDMLESMAGAVEVQVEDRLLAPATAVVTALEGASDSLRSAKGAAALLAADSEAADIAAVQTALDSGDVRRALALCEGKSVQVRSKALSGVLDSGVEPEQAFAGAVPPRDTLVKFAALLAMDLADRTETRLSWLYEVVTLMDDADEYDPADSDVIDGSRRRLVGTIQKLSDFQTSGTLAPAEAKHAKLLIRVLKAHLNAM